MVTRELRVTSGCLKDLVCGHKVSSCMSLGVDMEGSLGVL